MKSATDTAARYSAPAAPAAAASRAAAGTRPVMAASWPWRTRWTAVALAALAWLGAMLWHEDPFDWHTVTLRISGGDLMSSPHAMALRLQQAGTPLGLRLRIEPADDSTAALGLVLQGAADVALARGEVDARYDTLQRVAMMRGEVLHIVAAPGIAHLGALRGRRIALGPPGGDAARAMQALLRDVGWREGRDYVGVHEDSYRIVSETGERLPDAWVRVATPPDVFVDYLIRQRGWHLLAVPAAHAFARRHGWARAVSLGADLYGAAPTSPTEDLDAIGVVLQVMVRPGLAPQALDLLRTTLCEDRAATPLPAGARTAPGACPETDHPV